jgi:lysophospholipase L1-like esterase
MPASQHAGERAAGSRIGPLAPVLVTIAAIAVLLLAAEGAIRIRQLIKYGSSDRIEDAWTVDPRINLRVPVANYDNGRLSVNSLGFRGPEIAVPKPAGTVRIAYLGASTTWCGEVSSNDKVWPHLATASLSRAFPGARFDYINGGVPGYTIQSMTQNLQHRVAPLQPDVIVIYEASNNLSGEMRELAVKRGIIENQSVEVSSLPSRYSILWYLVEKNLRLKAAQRAAESGKGLLEVDPKSLGSDYRHALTELVLAAQRSAKVVAVATFAIQPRPGQSHEQLMRASSSALFYMPFVTPETIIDVYARFNGIIREVARETGVLLIEGENDIPGDAAHFTDSVHFSDAGSSVMAERISRALIASPAVQQLANPGNR